METKPGYKSSEFWLHILLGSLIAGLTALVASSSSFPPLVQGAVTILGPILITFLSKIYNDGRVAVKVATLENPPLPVPANDVEAAKVLAGVRGPTP